VVTPASSSNFSGFKLSNAELPIPILPVSLIRILSILPVLNNSGCASVVPRKLLAGLIPMLPFMANELLTLTVPNNR